MSMSDSEVGSLGKLNDYALQPNVLFPSQKAPPKIKVTRKMLEKIRKKWKFCYINAKSFACVGLEGKICIL